MGQFPRRCLALGNQFAQISSFFLRQLYDILLHGGLLLVEQWFGFSCSSRIPLFPSTHHFIMDRTLASNLTYQVVENEHGAPYIQWLGENHHITSTLLNSGTNLSFERQEILRVLKDAAGPLEAREIAKLTGQNYMTIRMALSRMHEAGGIGPPYRGN